MSREGYPSAVLAAVMLSGLVARWEMPSSRRGTESWGRSGSTSARNSFNRYPQGNLDDVLATVAAPHAGGVDIVTGTDASITHPASAASPTAPASHHELQMLVRAGLSPTAALRAATSTPARLLGLTDRGRIQPGLRAGLLLVDGDPATTISDTLNIRTAWRRGARLDCAHP